jgi:drug/metabolite transporter (DMT)-like permease
MPGMTRRGWGLFAVMSLIWGVPYLLIKVAVGEVAPPVVVAFRTSVAALVLVPLAASRGALGPALRRWRPLALFTVVEMAGPWILLADAERTLPSSVTGLIVATVPLVGTAIAFGLGDRGVLRPWRLVGLVTGLAGVALVVGAGRDGATGLRPVAEVLLVAVGYAVGPFIAERRLADVPSLGVIATALGSVAVLYLPLAIATAPRRMPSAAALGALVGLAVLCTGVAFVLFFALIAEAGPTRATLITFVNPAVALALGVVLLHEPLTTGLVVGFPLVIAGCWLASRHHRPGEAPSPPQPEPVPEYLGR